jgi:hypothetical protein
MNKKRNHDMTKTAIRCGVVAVLVAVAAGNALGEPGEGLQAGGDVLVRPFADVAISYDSNPLLFSIGDEMDDFFLDVSPGLSLTRGGEVLRMEGLFWGRFRRFEEFTSEDRDDVSEELRLELGRREGWRLRAHERFGRVSDYDISIRTMDVAAEGAGGRYLERVNAVPLSVMERSERVDRNILDCGIGLGGPLTDKMSLDMACDYGGVDYLSAEMLDSTEAKASVKAARRLTDKGSAILVAEYILMENDSLADSANYYAARAGWRWQGTFKSRFEGSAGYFSLSDSDSSLDDTFARDGFSYDAAWFWQARPKLSVTLGGRSEMQLAPTTPQDTKLVNMITGSGRYTATERLSLALLVGYRHEDYSHEEEMAGAPVKRVVEQLHGRLHCDYLLRKWLKAYGEVWTEDTEDNVRGDYKETRATLGMKAEY